MEKILPNPILSFHSNQLVEIRKLYGYNDVNKLKQDLIILEDWIEKQNHFTVRKFDRDYLERFLIMNKGSVEKTKKRLDKLLTLRNLMPEISQNYDVKNEFNYMFQCSYACVLPKPTKEHYRVVITKILDTNYEKVELIEVYRYFVVCLEYLLHNDYNAGYEYILDARDSNIGLLAKLNPVIIHKGMTTIEAYGPRLKLLHFVCNSKFFDTLMSIIKQGLSEKLRNRVQVHTTIESIYKYVPKEILPRDYGGNEKSIKELWESSFAEMCSNENIARIKHTETIMTDESCRNSSTFNEEYSGVPGSFKTLCVD